ncbi:MAG TPA: hypothetical protein VHH73_07395 [Verrucomicrobiae bacterium]|nr:hypothetical protein [Verrucomicrobiae bacterium]
MHSWKKGLLISGVVILAGLGLLAWPEKEPAAPPPLPNPNGYRVILAAGTNLITLAKDDSETTPEERVAWVEKNRAALEGLRHGLELPGRVPPVSGSEADAAIHLEELARLKSLARLLVAEGKGFEQNGPNSQAARAYLDAVRLGEAVSRGGLIIDQLVGFACTAIGMKNLEALRPRLGAADCRLVATELARIGREFSPVDEVFQRERMTYERRASVAVRLAVKFQRWIPNSGLNRSEASFRAKAARNRQELEKLAREFEDRAKELEARPVK